MKPHIPIRECIACGKKAPKNEMYRIVENEGIISLDIAQKSAGRGAYLCKDAACLALCFSKRKLSRAFRKKVSEEMHVRLEKELDTLE